MARSHGAHADIFGKRKRRSGTGVLWNWDEAEMILHFIRHGKTIANEKKLYCGATNLPLSPKGYAELATLKKCITYPLSPLYIVSGLLRTLQTANLLFDHPTLNTIPQLKEMHFGTFEMQGFKELSLLSSYQNWIADIENTTPPEGENKQTFVRRVMHGFLEVQHLCKLHSTNSALIVSHGGVIATIMEHHFPKHKHFYTWQPDFGRGYTLFLGENKHYKNI